VLEANRRPLENHPQHLAMPVTDSLKRGQNVVPVTARGQTQVQVGSQRRAGR